MAGEDLDSIAAAELIKEAKRGSERAKDMGAMGWRKCPLPTANKVFLNNTLLSIIGHSKRHQKTREQNRKNQERNQEDPRSVSKSDSSFERDRRSRTDSSHSHPERKISRTYRDDKERDCIAADKKSDSKKEQFLIERKRSHSSHFSSSHFSSSHREEKESKHKKKKKIE